jgi:hypothetical protein
MNQKADITLKAFANFSPGFALKPWVKKSLRILRNSEGVAKPASRNEGATVSGLRLSWVYQRFPGLPKRNPGLELANAFSVPSRHSSRFGPGLAA